MKVNGHIQFRPNRLTANLAIIVLIGKWTVADANKKAAPMPIKKRPKPLHSFFLFHLQSIKNAVTGFHQPLVVEEAYDTQCDDSED